jgi:hypothetical protein
MRQRFTLSMLLVAALAAMAPPLRAITEAPDSVVSVSTECKADSVTVGQRFDVSCRATFADSLKALTPADVPPGTCRLISSKWNDAREKDRAVRTGTLVFIPVSLDSAYVPPMPLDFVTPHGDTLRAWTDAIDLPIRLIATGSKDLKPLKQQWVAPRNWTLWIALVLAALALTAALVWWIRRRRRRVAPVEIPELRLPPDFVALKELERVAGLGLVERGEYKTFYTLVVDAVRRYVEARFGIVAMDRTTQELLDDLNRRHTRIDGLGALMTEADLVKFAKYTPTPASASAAIESAREIVVATTPRSVPSDEPTGATG